MARPVARIIARSALRRLGNLAILTVLVSLASFWLVRGLPGDPAYVLLGSEYTDEAYQALRTRLGLDQPTIVQLWNWWKEVAKGTLGISFVSRHRVATLLAEALVVTGSLTALAAIMVLPLTLAFGVPGFRRRHSASEALARIASAAAYATPSFVTGAILMTVLVNFPGWFPLLPRVDWRGAPWETLRGLLLPALTLALYYAGLLGSTLRSALRDAWRRDCLEFAQAHGLPFSVQLRYALRLAAGPVLSVAALSCGQLLSGAVLTETVFGLPGLGRLSAGAILDRDFPTLLPTVMLAALFFHLTAWGGDIARAYLHYEANGDNQ